MDWLFVLCSNEGDQQEVSGILDRGLFRVRVAVSWAGENAGGRHLRKSLALLCVKVQVFCVCLNWCAWHIWSHWAWVQVHSRKLHLVKVVRVKFRDLSPTYFDAFTSEYEPICLHFFFAKLIRALSFFLYIFEYPSAVCVCAVGQDVFISACIAKAKWLHAEHICTYMFYMAGRAPRRRFNRSFSHMHACMVKTGRVALVRG
jgi:hypothetical protein